MNYLTAILTVLLSTNEVHLGTATINNESYKVIGLQVVTNRIITKAIMTGPTDEKPESWTNTIPGPIVATNLVKAPLNGTITFSTDATNIYIPWYNGPTLVLTNYLGNPLLNAH